MTTQDLIDWATAISVVSLIAVRTSILASYMLHQYEEKHGHPFRPNVQRVRNRTRKIGHSNKKPSGHKGSENDENRHQ